MGCGEFLVKMILFVTNLLSALMGLVLLGLGIAVQLRIWVIVEYIDENFVVAPIFAMVIGSIIFTVSFMGCCGAIKESNCMLVSYSILLLMMMVVKLIVPVIIFVRIKYIDAHFQVWMEQLFPENAFNHIEAAFNCCGTNGASSYPGPLPPTCCAIPECTSLNAYGGCNETVSQFIDTFGILIGSFSIVVAAIELVTSTFALCLASHIRNKERRKMIYQLNIRNYDSRCQKNQ